MHIGYARVSTDEQETTTQESSLKHAGCEKIFSETASGGRWDRPQLARALDRLSRLLKDLLNVMERIDQLGDCFRSLTEVIETTTSSRTHDDANGRIICRV